MTIIGLSKRIDKLNTDLVIEKSFDATAEDLAQVNRERMLDGKKADGSDMPNYSFVSQTVYGYPDAPIKLKDTGDFQRSIVVTLIGNELVTESTDEKNEMLLERYGEDIFGTYGVYKRDYLENSLRPELNKQITEVTGLKFG